MKFTYPKDYTGCFLLLRGNPLHTLQLTHFMFTSIEL